MSNIWFLLNKTNDAYEIDVTKVKQPPEPENKPKSPPSPPPSSQQQEPGTPYRPSFLPPSKKSLKRETLRRVLVVPSELMKMKQGSAALQLGIPASTFSKRWRESLPERKWPFRTHRKLEKSMKMLVIMQKKGHNVTRDMERLRQQQEENLQPAIIHLYEDANDEGSSTITFISETPTPPPPPSNSHHSPQSPHSTHQPSPPLHHIIHAKHSPYARPPQFSRKHSPTPSPPLSPPSTADVYSFVHSISQEKYANMR